MYLDDCAYKFLNKQMTDYFILIKIFLKIRYYKCCIRTELIKVKELIMQKATTAKNA